VKVIDKIAELKSLPKEEVKQSISENASRFFGETIFRCTQE
jgi:Tat protein secretion system quality control protein TatD with DNase activity